MSTLYHYSQHGDPAVRTLVKHLLTQVGRRKEGRGGREGDVDGKGGMKDGGEGPGMRGWPGMRGCEGRDQA